MEVGFSTVEFAHPAVFGAVLAATAVGLWRYDRFAVRHGIIAKRNARTLHEQPVPRGGGAVLAVVFVLGTLALWLLGDISAPLALALAVGGAAAATIGFVDDVRELPALPKLGLHLCLSLWLFAVMYDAFLSGVLHGRSPIIAASFVAILLFVPLWLINLYNFIDGIDGLAGSAALLSCVGAAVVLWLRGGASPFVLLFLLLAVCSLGFLMFNLPPARVFMGDAGSIFLGYTTAVLAVATVVSQRMSIWTWIALLGYFVADTTTTTLLRIFLVSRWYGVHRSHAYQNLARIWKSHAKVTYGIVAYQIVWALPLAVWSSLQPRWAWLAALLAVAPAVLWTIRFGPRLSSD